MSWCCIPILAATPNAFSKPWAAFWRSSNTQPDGTVIVANENFCRILGWDPGEIKGKPHSQFVDPAIAKSPDYKAFWAKLGRGEFDSGEYKRIGKDGKEVWIQASYSPVVGAKGKVLQDRRDRHRRHAHEIARR